MKLCILLISNPESEIIFELEAKLTDFGLEPIATVDLSIAKKCILSFRPNIVLLNLCPNPQESLTLLKELKEEFQNTRFLVSYQKSDPELIMNAYSNGAFDYIPFHRMSEDLPLAIESIKMTIDAENLSK